VGIEFTEKMVGTAEGSAGSRRVQIDLTVRIEDLAEFVARHARDSRVRVPIVDGELTIGDKVFSLDPEASSLVLMARAGLDASGQEVRRIEYRLVTDGKKWKPVTGGGGWKPLTDGKKWTLEGKKTIQDDPGFDAWEDTTKLKITELAEAGDKAQQGDKSKEGERVVGELLLPAEAFFSLQLPSFKADTDDPARQAWAMAAFGKFFFGHLAAVYLPGLDRLGELTTGLTRRGRG